jgi:hypothetical protein
VSIAEISTASLEYVRVPVSATASGSAVNPTADTVVMAFIDGTDAPGASDWKTASWETDANTEPDTYYARCLVGTGGAVVLTAGTYSVWVKVTDSPETPVKRCGLLRVV